MARLPIFPLGSRVGFANLVAGLIALATMSLFAFTDVAWQLGGRLDEDYPEKFFFVFGLPPALLAVATGAWLYLNTAPNVARQRLIPRMANWAAIAVCAGLAVFAIWPLVVRTIL